MSLLAHELTHVLQQGGGSGSPAVSLQVSRPDDAAEIEAEQTSQRLMRDTSDTRQMSFSPARLSVQRAPLTCETSAVVAECGGATAKCLTAADYCKAEFKTPADLDKAIADGKAMIAGSGAGPNAQKNFLHWLDASGSELEMPSSVFEGHRGTKIALQTAREKFLDGARKRLEDGTLAPGATSELLKYTGHANAFLPGGDGRGSPPPRSDDLAYAVGGFQLCSNVLLKADPVGKTRFKVQFLKWQCQAFDCYNWDPGKGIGIIELPDRKMCCIENAGKGKHFLIHSTVWNNTDADSLKSEEIDASLPSTKAATPSGATPPPSGR